ncbi:apoptosis regulator BAX-like [Ruditapes philippinarum]|uniref:apoptosis regulator BAX-like n=1 Tax=Ruditapes philippinarum TaxID=129788 RepID=UPI00295B46C5|nr:apoptosis regulator BAX-like [Ruditapes philippinarum]
MPTNSIILYNGMMATVAPSEREYPGGCVNPRLRRISMHLDKLELPDDNRKNPFFEKILQGSKVSAEETKEEGKILFKDFIVKEFEEEGLDTPDVIRTELENICTPQGFPNPTWAKVGQDLRRYADEFQRSKERKKVQKRAAEITENRSDVTQDQFKDLLSNLLRNGITRERIIVLFFFCSDVAIATLKRGSSLSVELCQRFIQWSFDFITEKICSWVQANGGWGAVFSSTMVIVGRAALMVGVGMICYYGYKKFIKN